MQKEENIKERNFRKIIDTAISFLNLPLEFDEMLPSIVHHPFINWVGMPYENNGEMEILDVRKDEELEKIQEQIAEKINNAKGVHEIVQLINKPYRAVYFKYIYEYLIDEEYSKELVYIWQQTEFPHHDVNVSVKEFRKMFEKSSKKYTMTEAERKMLEEMPEEIRVFRGFATSEYYDALSWTTDEEVASFFSHRFGRDGEIYEGMIERKYVYAFLEEESEIILDYKKIKNVKRKIYKKGVEYSTLLPHN